MIKHQNRKHAILSASGADRWINCPASARLEEKYGVDSSSVFAEEGTLAHEFADLKLRVKSSRGQPVGVGSIYRGWTDQLKELRKNELYTYDMEGYVEMFTDYVLEKWVGAMKETPDALLSIEERSDFSHVAPEGFGTSDANIITDNHLEIVDLKYGKGVQVFAEKNAQLRLYAIGVLKKFGLLYGIESVTMTIVQPRLNHISSETITASELVKWGEEVVKPAAADAWEGGGKTNPGAACKWCKAKAFCKGLAAHNLELAKLEFADPRTLSDDEIISAYEKGGLLVDWMSALNKHVLAEALAGKDWAGYKLVEGRANRKWSNEADAIEKLKAKGFKADQLINTKIKGLGDIEKLVSKKVFDKMGLTIKPQGAPTLVPETDKRPGLGIAQAKKDFS